MSNIFIYSLGEFLNLDNEILLNKAIIRIYNSKAKDWEEDNSENNVIKIFFDDIKKFQLKWYEKIDFFWIKNFFTSKDDSILLSDIDAKKLISFIKKNKEKDFLIHCEFGKSRSVAVGLFIEKYFDGKIINKTKDECLGFNDLVIEKLEKNRK